MVKRVLHWDWKSVISFALLAYICIFSSPVLSQIGLPDSIHHTRITVIDQITGIPIPKVNVESRITGYSFAEPAYKLSETVGVNSKGEFALKDGWKDTDVIRLESAGYDIITISIGEIRKNGYRIALVPGAIGYCREFDAIYYDRFLPDQEAKTIVECGNTPKGNQILITDEIRKTGMFQIARNQYAGGTIGLPGFGANQIALLVNGEKVNQGFFDAQNAYAALLPTAGIQRIEYKSGPTSIYHGSGAMGGLVNIHTNSWEYEDYRRKKVNWGGKVQGRYNSNWKGVATEGVLRYFHGDIFSKTSGAWIQTQNVQTGRNGLDLYRYPAQIPADGLNSDSLMDNPAPATLPESGFKRLEINQLICLTALGGYLYDVYVDAQYARLPNTTRNDKLALRDNSGNPLFTAWENTLRDRFSLASGFKLELNNNTWDIIHVDFSHQRFVENTTYRNWGDTLRRYYDDLLHQYNFKISTSSPLSGFNQLNYGFRLRQESSLSRAWGQPVSDDGSPVIIQANRPDGGGTMMQVGGFLDYFHHIRKGFNYWFSLAYDRNVTQVNYKRGIELPWLPYDYKMPNNAISGSTGLHQYIGDGFDWTVLASTGYRTLNIQDASLVYQSKLGFPLAPNPVLRPEYIINAEASFAHQFLQTDRQEFTVYYQRMLDGFALAPSDWEGNDSVTYLGETSAIQSIQNIKQAHHIGFRLNANWPISKQLTAQTNLNGILIYPAAKTQNTIPSQALYGITRLVWTQKRFEITGSLLFSSAQTSITTYFPTTGGIDNSSKYRGYCVPSAYIQYFIGNQFTLEASFENCFDQNYRIAGSAISEPGRSIGVGARFDF